jgi:hypothetical protein
MVQYKLCIDKNYLMGRLSAVLGDCYFEDGLGGSVFDMFDGDTW